MKGHVGIFYFFLTIVSHFDCHTFVKLRDFRWVCENNICKRIDMAKSKAHKKQRMFTLEGCKTICGKYGALWPIPTGELSIADTMLNVIPENIKLEFYGDEKIDKKMRNSFRIFKSNLLLLGNCADNKEHTKLTSYVNDFVVSIDVRSKSDRLNMRTNESYKLTVEQSDEGTTVVIEAETFFGARHGLETLSQFITYDLHTQTLQLPSAVVVVDEPVFPYRGLLIDTGRNYFSVESIKRIIDAMSYNKMNVLHWHMNEQQSFPFVSESVPELTEYGAYSKDHLYFKSDIQSLVAYAHQRGILLLPEFDAPAHAAYGWNFGEDKGYGKLVACFQKKLEEEHGLPLAAEVPPGQLDPTNPWLFKLLGKLYRDLLVAFGQNGSLEMFHMGGDEVNFVCWWTEDHIRKWLSEQGYNESLYEGYYQLWAHFQTYAEKKLIEANNLKEFPDGVILWASRLTDIENIDRFLKPSHYIIQVWESAHESNGENSTVVLWLRHLLTQGYRLLFSPADSWYLDCGYDNWMWDGSGRDNNWCSPYKGWRTMYNFSLYRLIKKIVPDPKNYIDLILGGEGAMWSEQVDEHSVESKLWPRASAIAERLWSEPSGTWRSAEKRLLEQRHRMVQRGVRADAVQPEFCRQHEGHCRMKRKKPPPPRNETTTKKPRWKTNRFLKRTNAPKVLVAWTVCVLIAMLAWLRRRYIILGPAGFIGDGDFYKNSRSKK